MAFSPYGKKPSGNLSPFQVLFIEPVISSGVIVVPFQKNQGYPISN
jgi:hypothetical protein